MAIPEIVIWSAMAGVLLCLVALAIVDALLRRRAASFRLAVFFVVATMTCILMSGLPEALWPLAHQELLPAKAVMGPLSAALALGCLVRWSALSPDDALVRGILGRGVPALWLATAGLVVWAQFGVAAAEVLAASGLIVASAVVMGALVAARGVAMGDRAARWMVLACLFLSLLVPGLHAKALDLCAHPGHCAVTATATVGYFLVVLALVGRRNHQFDQLRRQAAGVLPRVAGGGLPRGVQLVEQVDGALWRSARMERPCVVAAVVVSNLYALGERAPLELEQDAEVSILLALAARMRHALGFRNVLGLYHQRCFILAVSGVQDPQRADIVVGQLLQSLRMAVQVSPDPLLLPFEPDVAIGVVRVAPGGGHIAALDVMNLAEKLALEATGTPGRVVQAQPGARPTVPQGLPVFLDDTFPAPLAA